MRGEPRDYAERLPSAADVACVIEVADASLGYDRTRKLSLYARAGIAQYVIVNLREQAVEIHEDPQATGYRRVEVRRGTQTFELRAGQGERLVISADRILP